MVLKHVAFAPGNKWGQAPFCKKEDILIQKMGPGPIYSQGFALLSLLERLLRRFAPRNARSAVLTVFSPYSPRQARESDTVGRRVCLSEASYGAAEKSELRMASKI